MLVKSQVKYIQSLSQKKLRDSEGVFVAEGPKLINELLYASNIRVQELFAVKEWLAQHPSIPVSVVTEVSAGELERISFLKTPNQVMGIFRKPEFPGTVSWQGKLSLALDTIQDPGNMGTILRCADWFGIEQVVCSPDCADLFNPKVVQATMGSISRVQIKYEDLLPFIQHLDIPVYAAALKGVDIHQLKPVPEGLLLVGNESKGIDPELLALCEQHITIPGKGRAESLNVAVATGIILSHLT